MTEELTLETATGYLQADHRRLDALMEKCRACVQARDMQVAGQHFTEFRKGLMRHIKIEEGLVFPEFEVATGLGRSQGPTGVMRFEHEEIIRLLDLMRDLFTWTQPDPDEFKRLHGTLMALLMEHNGKEERILYPMTDQMVPPERHRVLMDSIKAFK
jgi:hemerythrin superfamily protein